MKITVEIMDGKFHYNYEVGKDKCGGSNDICINSLGVFTRMLTLCHQASDWDYKKTRDKYTALAYAEKNPKEMKKFIEDLKEV